MTTSFSLQSKSATSTFSNQAKNASVFTLQDRDMSRSLLLKEDGDYLLAENGAGIVLEQSVQGDEWSLQPKN